MIHNRIFVADEIENSGLAADWAVFYNYAKNTPTKEGLEKQRKFQTALLRVARNDLRPVGMVDNMRNGSSATKNRRGLRMSNKTDRFGYRNASF